MVSGGMLHWGLGQGHWWAGRAAVNKGHCSHSSARTATATVLARFLPPAASTISSPPRALPHRKQWESVGSGLLERVTGTLGLETPPQIQAPPSSPLRLCPTLPSPPAPRWETAKETNWNGYQGQTRRNWSKNSVNLGALVVGRAGVWGELRWGR